MMKQSSCTDIKIRTVPSNVNPTPRPSTPGRPGTSSGLKKQGFSSGVSMTTSNRDSSFNVFDNEENGEKSVFDDLITEDYLRKAAGNEDLDSVVSIHLKIDTSYQSLLDIGDQLKRLDYLILDGSKVCSIRDLGVGLKFLSTLSVNDCGLSELDGIGMLTNLKELSARDNNIEDVTALALHETVETIDLHGNRISDVAVADTLSSCPNLRHLDLSGNSLERAPKYRLVIAAMIPHLESLDGENVDANAKKKVSNGMILEAASAMQLEQEELDDERRMEMELMGDGMFFESNTTTSEVVNNFMTGMADNGNGGITDGTIVPDNDSDLTHGSAVVLAGNMAMAIRRRRNGSPRASSSDSKTDTKDDTDGNYLSTLATLDSASHFANEKSHEHYFGEGDITKAMRKHDKSILLQKASSPKNSQYRKKNIPTSTSLVVNTSQSNSSESAIQKKLSSPIAAAIISAAHSQNSVMFDRDELNDPKSSGISGGSPSGWASRPMSRSQSRRSNTSSRSSSPANRNNTSTDKRKPPKSPPTWQRNASRPQSTTSSGRGTAVGIAGGIAPSAPFKVISRDNKNSPCQSPLLPRNEIGKATIPPAEKLGNLSQSRGDESGNINKSAWRDSFEYTGESSGEEEDDDRNRRGKPFAKSSDHKKTLSHAVEKKDRVLRGLLFANEEESCDQSSNIVVASLSKRESGNSYDEDDDDNENFATDHKSRHERMLAEQKERLNNKSKQKQMMTFSHLFDDSQPSRCLKSSQSMKSTDSDVQESSINLSDCITSSDQSSDRDSSASGKQLSEVATRSLGFDLKGSLAAINQWVDEQDSDEDEGDEEDNVNFGKYGDIWNARNEMKRATTAQKKILSRDKILGMCTGYNDSKESGSRLTAKNLALNGDGYSYDMDDDNESDCEENDVMFYDNNVNKSDGLSKSCSLLTIGGFGNADKTDKDVDEKVLMSKSIQLGKPPKSPRPKKRSVKRESSKNSVASEIPIDSRGCTPSTSEDVQVKTSTPARDTLETEVRNSPSNDVREIESSTHRHKKIPEKVKIEFSTDTVSGTAVSLADEQLVYMLSQPPKAIPALKTKSGFQDFFRGMPVNRMQQLLELAYKEMSELDRDNKVKKRMDLLHGVLSE